MIIKILFGTNPFAVLQLYGNQTQYIHANPNMIRMNDNANKNISVPDLDFLSLTNFI